MEKTKYLKYTEPKTKQSLKEFDGRLLVTFAYKDFKKQNGYDSRGNFATAKKYLKILNTTKTYFQDFLLKINSANSLILIDILHSFNLIISPSNQISRDSFRTYCFDQNYSGFLYPDDIEFSKKNKDGNQYSNGSLYAKTSGLKYFPLFYGTDFNAEKDNEPVYGFYYRPETFPIQSKIIREKIKELGPTKNIYILGANLNEPEFQNYNIYCTQNDALFYSKINTFIFPLQYDPGDVLPNCIIHAILNDNKIEIIDKNLKKPDLSLFGTDKNNLGLYDLYQIFGWDSLQSKTQKEIAIDIIEKSIEYFIKDFLLFFSKTLTSDQQLLVFSFLEKLQKGKLWKNLNQ